jgi:hypothetical protein
MNRFLNEFESFLLDFFRVFRGSKNPCFSWFPPSH